MRKILALLFAPILIAVAIDLVRPAPVPAADTAGTDLPEAGAGEAVAVFAGGCFWCMEPPYDKLAGVKSTTSGYIGGAAETATYQQTSAGGTGHAEAVRIVYDPEQVDYERLLHIFWRNIDPTVDDRQFCDVGSQYRPAIFPRNDRQRQLAEQSLAELRQTKPFDEEIEVEIENADTFYPAEDYHQDYYMKNPLRYKYYRFACGRDARLKELWGDEAGGAAKSS